MTVSRVLCCHARTVGGADGLGSTLAITDDIGDVIRDYTYDVYGQVTGGSGSTPNEFDFAGQQSDDSTGLQYLRAPCQRRSDGIWGCFGLSKKLFDSLGGRAITIGNVILTKEKSWDYLGEDLIRHEIRHADQWALAGLTTPGAPILGQAGFAATYSSAQGLFGTCGNPFERWAGVGPGSGVRRSCK